MNEDLRFALKAISFAIAFTVGMIVLIVIIMHPIEAQICKNKSVSFADHRKEFFGGCMVTYKGEWVPLNNIRFDMDE